MSESVTAAALRRGAETVDVCRCVGEPIRQPGGCFTCGKPRTAPKKPELPAVQPYVPPEKMGNPRPSTSPLTVIDLPAGLREYASGV